MQMCKVYNMWDKREKFFSDIHLWIHCSCQGQNSHSLLRQKLQVTEQMTKCNVNSHICPIELYHHYRNNYYYICFPHKETLFPKYPHFYTTEIILVLSVSVLVKLSNKVFYKLYSNLYFTWLGWLCSILFGVHWSCRQILL